MDEALCDFGTFTFVALHIFSAEGQHVTAVAEILRLIEILEELHNKVQGVITPPQTVTTFLYDVLRR